MIVIKVGSYTETYRQTLENGYNRIVDQYFGGSYILEEFTANTFINVAIFWIIGCAFLVVDLTDWPGFMQRYKMRATSHQITYSRMIKLVKQVLFNQTIGSIIGIVMYNHKYRLTKYTTTVPTLSSFIFMWCGFIFIREVLYYYSHRLLHHGPIYKRIHKIHHEWQMSIGLTDLYCHPIEHIASNMMPVIMGPFLFNSHSMVNNLWFLWIMLTTVSDHSGYHLPFWATPTFHDFHHIA